MTTYDLTPRRTWIARLCARMGGWCELVRGAHAARIPF